MLYLKSTRWSNEIVKLRETKTQLVEEFFIDEDGEMVCERFKKVPNRGYVAHETAKFSQSRIYELTSDFAIKTLGEKILTADHPEKEYIKKRYEFLESVRETRNKLAQLCNSTWDENKLNKVNKLLEEVESGKI